jgi:hypothetical protein
MEFHEQAVSNPDNFIKCFNEKIYVDIQNCKNASYFYNPYHETESLSLLPHLD